MSCRSVPLEILCEIFHILCEKPIALHVLENRTRFDEFPWAVGQVCRRWREAFLSYPPLWTSLSLDYLDDYNPDLDGFAEMNRRTALYIKRSQQLPITITVSLIPPCEFEVVELRTFPRAVWRSLISCSNRWEKAVLVLGNNLVMFEDLLKCRGKLSILKSMALDMPGVMSERTALDSAFDSVFAVAPHLTDLKMKFHRTNRNWVFPWSQLTNISMNMFSMAMFSYSQLVTLLSQLQNVEALILFSRHDEYHPLFDISTPIRLARVRFLDVSLVYYPKIFKWLEMPLLEHLSVYDTQRDLHPDDTSSWTSFISSLSCHIHHLTLQCCRNILASIIMKALPTAEHLCLKDPLAGSLPLLILRMSNSDNIVFLPNLQELRVICCPLQAGDELIMAISHLLETRGQKSKVVLSERMVAPIKKVVIELAWGDLCLRRFKACCSHLSDGLRVGVIDNTLEQMGTWSIKADICIDKSLSQVTIQPTLGTGQD